MCFLKHKTYVRETYYIRKVEGGGGANARNRKDRPPVLNLDSATPLLRSSSTNSRKLFLSPLSKSRSVLHKLSVRNAARSIEFSKVERRKKKVRYECVRRRKKGCHYLALNVPYVIVDFSFPVVGT